ncbi:MAG: hypothetical protein C4337_05420 [Armatimonadota bacterium]
MRCAELREEAQHMSRHKKRAMPMNRLGDTLTVFQGACQRLFAYDRLACRNRWQSVLHMAVGGGTDINDIAHIQQAIESGRHGHTILLTKRLRPLPMVVISPCHHHIGHLQIGVHMLVTHRS